MRYINLHFTLLYFTLRADARDHNTFRVVYTSHAKVNDVCLKRVSLLSCGRWYVGDRYPMRYGRNRTTTTMIAKVASVWIISVSVCLPLLVMGFVDRSTVYEHSTCVPTAKQVRAARASLSKYNTATEQHHLWATVTTRSQAPLC